VTDTSQPRRRLDTSALRPGQFVYEMTVERDAGSTRLGTRTVTVAQTTYANTPVWSLVESRSGEGGVANDTLLTDLALRPVHWASTIDRARLAGEFRGDSLYGAVTAPGGRRSVVAGFPPGAIVSSAMLETVIRLLPLQTAWEDSTTIVSLTASSTVVLAGRIAVIGDDRVRVPAGTYDCWIVSVHAGDSSRGLYWVTKRDPIVVRSALEVPILGGAQLVSALSRNSQR
jgi:hypothetical protein